MKEKNLAIRTYNKSIWCFSEFGVFGRLMLCISLIEWSLVDDLSNPIIMLDYINMMFVIRNALYEHSQDYSKLEEFFRLINHANKHFPGVKAWRVISHSSIPSFLLILKILLNFNPFLWKHLSFWEQVNCF